MFFRLKNNKILLALTLVAFFVSLFLSTNKVWAEGVSIDVIKSKLDQTLSEATQIIENNNTLKKDRLKLVKTVTVPSGYAVSEQTTTIPGKETELAKLDAEISSNNTKIDAKRDLALGYFARMQNKVTDDDADTLKEYSTKINNTFNQTLSEGAEPLCWSWTGGFQIGMCVIQVGSWISSIIIYLFGTILYLSGELFDVTVRLSLSWIRDVFASEGVELAWKMIRDFANLFFVFILLYIAVGTIFDLKVIKQGVTKTIVNVIIVALLVNFSGLFVRLVVDATNIVANEFYYSIITTDANGSESDNIGSYLVKRLAPVGYLSKNSAPSMENRVIIKNNSFFGVLVQLLFAILIILIGSAVLAFAAVLFLIRSIVLILVYIVSPFAFMSRIIPNEKFNYFQTWLNSLIKQAVMAPAFLIPLYVIFLLIEKGMAETGMDEMKGSLDATASGVGGAALTGSIIIGLLIACIFIAQKVSAIGGEAIPGLADKAKQILSRPLSRYGGRVANRVGARIAGSPVGKIASNQWNNGSLRLVRRSWDTGALRTARESEYGKRAGKAIRNPLTTALGVEPFSVDKRAKSILDDVKKLETDEQKSRFVEGLAGFRGREEFDYIYDNMGDEERRKVELAAQKILADPNASAGSKAGARMVSTRMEENRKKLSGNKAQSMAAELFKNSKGEAKLTALEGLSQGDLAGVYKKLSNQERAELDGLIKKNRSGSDFERRTAEARSSLSGSGAQDMALERFREADDRDQRVAAMNSLNEEDMIVAYRKMKPQERAQLAQDISRDPLASPFAVKIAAAQSKLSSGQQTATERMMDSEQARERVMLGSVDPNDIMNIHQSHITGLDVRTLSNPEVAKNLRVEQLDALRGAESTLKPSDRNAIREQIVRAYEEAEARANPTAPPAPTIIGAPTPPPPPAPVPIPKNLSTVYAWLKGNGSSF